MPTVTHQSAGRLGLKKVGRYTALRVSSARFEQDVTRSLVTLLALKLVLLAGLSGCPLRAQEPPATPQKPSEAASQAIQTQKPGEKPAPESRITSNADLELENSFAFLTAGEPNIVAPFRQLNPRRPNHYAFDPSSFAQPAQLGIIGDSPRTVCCGPGINGFDLALLKDTAVSERTELQFRAEFFNLFNHTQFVNPDGNISDGATFGTVVRTRDPRLIQFAVKLVF